MAKFDESSTNFAFHLMQKVAKENQNAFFSPASITLALGMCYAGSDGNTKMQMKKHFFGDADDSEIHGNLHKLVTALNEPNEHLQLNTANRLYCQKDFAILQKYRDLLEKSYHSGILSVDFVSHAESVRKEINDWVSKTTHDKINDLIPESAFNAGTRLVLVNALYFKAEWSKKFEKAFTTQKPFHITSTKSQNVDMMKQTAHYDYAEDDKCQVVSMPYVTHKVKMVVILPKDKCGLAKLEKEMTASYLLNLMKSMQNCNVNLELPKMKLEQSFELNDALKALGVTDAFDQASADFSNISGKKDLFISDVLHKAFVEVNEDGTEAAAATAIMMALCSAMFDPSTPKDFVADHPFMFAIVNSSCNTLLFLGHYYGSSS